MCGIFAWWPSSAVRDPGPAHRRGLDALAPRGPDGEGVWTAPDGRAWLGHRRLAITGVRGSQPLVSPAARHIALVNGEFYDAALHRRAFERQGVRFATDTDSELLLPLYARFGEEALEHLEGEFAFVLWDRAQDRVWMARDRAGVKPLRVAEGPRGLAAASEAKALLAAGWGAGWDENALADALALQYPHPASTLFAGIGQLEPGESRTYVRAADGTWSRATSRRWWTWFGADRPTDPTPEDASVQLEGALVGAVRRRLETPWPVAVHLSGGLDSSAILALASRQRSEGLAAFSVAFDAAPGAVVHDESAVAEETARRCGVPWHRVAVPTAALLDEWPAAVARAEGFGVNGHLVAKRCLAAAIRAADYRITLTGEGADEALLGYAFLAADASGSGTALDAAALWAANPVAHGVMLPDGVGLDLSPIEAAWGWVPTWLRAKAVLGARLTSLMKTEWAHERLTAAVARWASSEIPRSNAPRVHQAAAAWARRALGGYMLPALADAPEAGMGIENRVPFLDASVLLTATSWAPAATGWPLETKAPLRRLLERRGLASIAARPKHPFEAPPLWSHPGVRTTLRTLWSDPEVWRSTPFSPAAVVGMMDRLDAADAAERQRWEPVVATLLSVVSFAQAYGLESPL